MISNSYGVRRESASVLLRLGLGLGLLAACLLAPVQAGPMTRFTGSATGTFVLPAGGVTTGVGTSNFTWGVPVTQVSSLSFAGQAFDVTTPTGYIYGNAAQNARPSFALGSLTYHNGTIQGGTGADAVTLDAAVTLTGPVAAGPSTVASRLNLINSPNTNDPVASADLVFLPRNLPPASLATVGGARIAVEPSGFGQVTAGGFTGIDRFFVFEDATASADLVARIASPCEPIVRNGVAVSGVGTKTMSATFVPNFSLNMVDAAALCGYDHFNWLQTIYNDPYPPSAQTPPYIDPPVGGGPAFGGCADDLPFYWDERLCPTNSYSLLSNTTANSLLYSDAPAESQLQASEFLGFITALVGVNTDSTYEILYSWSWKSDNTGASGGVFRRTLSGDSDLGGPGGIFDVSLDLSPADIPAAVRDLWTASGASNADNGLALLVPEPPMGLLVAFALLAAASLNSATVRPRKRSAR